MTKATTDASATQTHRGLVEGSVMTESPLNPTAPDEGRGVSDPAAPNPHSTTLASLGELLPGIAGLPQLIRAYKSGDCDRLRAIREEFENKNGCILDAYISSKIHACAILVWRSHIKGRSSPEKKSGSGRQRSRNGRQHLFIWVDRRDLVEPVSAYGDALWRTLWLARRTEGAVDAAIPRATRAVIADMVYTVAVFLLASVDVLENENGSKGAGTDRELLTAAAKSGNAELDKLEDFLDKEAIRATVRNYLLGLSLGVLMLAFATWIIHIVAPSDLQWLLVLSVLAGGVGAVTSVMVRITRGQRLSVDTKQGPAVTLLAGGFRPLVGAVFGLAFYVLVVSNLIPIEVATAKEHFYAALAFLAGFSERWAQDTIVRSAPISPSPATRRDEAQPNAQQTAN